MYLKHENIVCNSTILTAYSRISRYMYRICAWSHHGSIFINILPYKSAILDLSVLFKANYPVIFAQIIQ